GDEDVLFGVIGDRLQRRQQPVELQMSLVAELLGVQFVRQFGLLRLGSPRPRTGSVRGRAMAGKRAGLSPGVASAAFSAGQVPVLALISATSSAVMSCFWTKVPFSTCQPTKGVLTSPNW